MLCIYMEYATISILHCCLYDVLSLNNVMIGCTSWYGIEGIDIVCLHLLCVVLACIEAYVIYIILCLHYVYIHEYVRSVQGCINYSQ